MVRKLRIARTQFAALLLTSTSLFAFAGTFSATPVRLGLSSQANTTSLVLENTGEQSVLVQAEVMSWTQKDGQDQLEASSDLLVSPPIFKLPAGAKQVIRVGLMRPVDPVRELTYRLFLQEVPQPAAPGQAAISFVLRLGLPVFVLPVQAAAAPRLKWHAEPGNGDRLNLSLSNLGNVHVRAADCTLLGSDGLTLATHDLAGYVLAGQTRSWQIKTSQPWRGGPLRLKARVDDAETGADLGEP
jgi:fimbrial chaperone protein